MDHRHTTRRLGIVIMVAAATTLLGGCGGSDDSFRAGPDPSGRANGDADEVVATAVEAVLGDDPFRARVTGGIPFFSPSWTVVYEQSGDDALEISEWDSYGTATVLVDDMAHEWDSWDGQWRRTPIESYDPLLPPGFGYGMALMGLIDWSDRRGFQNLEDLADLGDAEGEAEQLTDDLDELEVATGWTETTDGSDGLRRFERTLSSGIFQGEGPGDDAPVERHEEDAITGEYYRHARVTSLVEIDRDGHIVRNVLRHVFDGAPDHPDCAPLERLVGTTELVVNYRDVGVDFTITVPEPDELVATYPSFGEAPNFSDDDFGGIDSAFRNEAGERDLTGCPRP